MLSDRHRDPKLIAHVALILDRVLPVLNKAVRFGGGRGYDDAMLGAWQNGAIYAATGTFLLLAARPGSEVDGDDIAVAWAVACELIEAMFASDPPSMDAALERLLPELFDDAADRPLPSRVSPIEASSDPEALAKLIRAVGGHLPPSEEGDHG